MFKRALAIAWMGVWIGAGLMGCGSSQHSRVIVTETKVEILEQILFATGSDQLPANATAMIEAVTATLDNDPSIRKIAVEAHTAPDDGATPAERDALGKRRAQAIVDGLIAHGIAVDRVEPATASDGPQRIAFVILQRNPQ